MEQIYEKLIDYEKSALPKWEPGLITERGFQFHYCHCPRCLNNIGKKNQGFKNLEKKVKTWYDIEWCCYECGWEGYEDALFMFYNDGGTSDNPGIWLNVQ